MVGTLLTPAEPGRRRFTPPARSNCASELDDKWRPGFSATLSSAPTELMTTLGRSDSDADWGRASVRTRPSQANAAVSVHSSLSPRRPRLALRTGPAVEEESWRAGETARVILLCGRRRPAVERRALADGGPAAGGDRGDGARPRDGGTRRAVWRWPVRRGSGPPGGAGGSADTGLRGLGHPGLGDHPGREPRDVRRADLRGQRLHAGRVAVALRARRRGGDVGRDPAGGAGGKRFRTSSSTPPPRSPPAPTCSP